MPKFRTKPVVKEAIRFTPDNIEELKRFVGKDLIVGHSGCPVAGMQKESYKIRTLEGDMLVSDGDYIIKGLRGEFYPCKPDIFEKTYEPVEDQPND